MQQIFQPTTQKKKTLSLPQIPRISIIYIHPQKTNNTKTSIIYF